MPHVFTHICSISHVATILARVIVVITCGVIHVQNTWSHVPEVCDYKYWLPLEPKIFCSWYLHTTPHGVVTCKTTIWYLILHIVFTLFVGWPSCRRSPERRFGKAGRIPSCLREASLGSKNEYGWWKLSLLCSAPWISHSHERWRCELISLWPLVPCCMPQKTDTALRLSHLYQEQLRHWKWDEHWVFFLLVNNHWTLRQIWSSLTH